MKLHEELTSTADAMKRAGAFNPGEEIVIRRAADALEKSEIALREIERDAEEGHILAVARQALAALKE